ncbi:MAG: short-chain dehydrogenase/reductase [Beijerinckiaceae bacterium]|nr:MAG: short-chain dehydrogenase/reductase [Beijerinckiaceae bacterium]
MSAGAANKGVALITGGSRGIGRACALGLAEDGFDVVVNYVGNKGAADEVVAAITAKGRKAVAVQGDVSVEADVAAIFAAADKLGTLKALVNNAGVVDIAQPVVEMSTARFRRMFDINVMGSFFCAREAIKRMSTRLGGTGGAIVNMSSIAPRLGAPGQYVDYAAAKGAIDAFTLGLGREVANEGIRVNGVQPGLIETDIHASGGIPDRIEQLKSSIPIKRGGTADEIAEAVRWLVSDKASYAVGSLITVSGGR